MGEPAGENQRGIRVFSLQCVSQNRLSTKKKNNCREKPQLPPWPQSRIDPIIMTCNKMSHVIWMTCNKTSHILQTPQENIYPSPWCSPAPWKYTAWVIRGNSRQAHTKGHYKLHSPKVHMGVRQKDRCSPRSVDTTETGLQNTAYQDGVSFTTKDILGINSKIWIISLDE